MNQRISLGDAKDSWKQVLTCGDAKDAKKQGRDLDAEISK